MKLRHLVEMMREDSNGAEGWPVLFASYRRNPGGEWHEVDGARCPVTSVEVDNAAGEVLLVTASSRPPLLLTALVEELARLTPQHGESTVDCCDTPIAMDGGIFHIDVPIVGAGRDEGNRCYLVVFASEPSK
jgi:hypothetical protein